LTILLAGAVAPLGAAPLDGPWTDATLVENYHELTSRGDLAGAILDPSLPDHSPRTAFLDALAWFAAGTPRGAGTLTMVQLDEFLHGQARYYERLLRSKVVSAEANDYPRTRTWKVIQKLTLLRREMSGSSHAGTYSFPAISMAPDRDDPWEREHTLSSPEEFAAKVCAGSHDRPILVKFGNTNCTQCMLFEMIGSVKEVAQNPAYRDSLDVYKVWWGMQPDDSFAGRIRNPERLDDLADAEGVHSSPYFIVYRDGRRYPCGGAFPDGGGMDEDLDACIKQELRDGPVAAVCATSSSGL